MEGLTTPHLRLRPLRPADADALHEVYSHPLVEAWIGPHSRERVAQEIDYQVAGQAERGYSVWALEDRRDGRLLGDCGLQPLEHKGPEVELGYDLHPDVWGQGLATEAATRGRRGRAGPAWPVPRGRRGQARQRRVAAGAGEGRPARGRAGAARTAS